MARHHGGGDDTACHFRCNRGSCEDNHRVGQSSRRKFGSIASEIKPEPPSSGGANPLARSKSRERDASGNHIVNDGQNDTTGRAITSNSLASIASPMSMVTSIFKGTPGRYLLFFLLHNRAVPPQRSIQSLGANRWPMTERELYPSYPFKNCNSGHCSPAQSLSI